MWLIIWISAAFNKVRIYWLIIIAWNWAVLQSICQATYQKGKICCCWAVLMKPLKLQKKSCRGNWFVIPSVTSLPLNLPLKTFKKWCHLILSSFQKCHWNDKTLILVTFKSIRCLSEWFWKAFMDLILKVIWKSLHMFLQTRDYIFSNLSVTTLPLTYTLCNAQVKKQNYNLLQLQKELPKYSMILMKFVEMLFNLTVLSVGGPVKPA